jgi:predicted ATPase/DNA-binding SARP family transcriptional activator
VEFLILGPLEVRSEGQLVVLPGRRQRALMALLLLRANEAVSADSLVEGLWGEKPPKSASHALQVFVSDLRKAFRAVGESERIVTRSPGYLIRVDADELDVHRFERLATEGRNALARDDPAAASAVLAEALTLWRGDPLADFAFEAFAQEAIARLEEQRLSALEDRIAADLQLGKHAELIGELEALTAKHAYRESLRHHLMLALYRAGRQSEALAVYQETRKLLLNELGIDPKPELQELERAILNQDADLEVEVVQRQRTLQKTPHNLPLQLTSFIGRERELEELRALLARDELRLVTVTGPGGIGKTRLALQAAAECLEYAPDGVFGAALAPLRDPRLLVTTLLTALSLREQPGEEPLETLVSFLQGKRVLLLLDNLEQLLPEAAQPLAELLARTRELTLLVTSRAPVRLSGEHEYPLAPLTEREAVTLFTERARLVRPAIALDGDAAAVAAICARLDRLPLALELAAARVKILPPRALLQRLEGSLKLLTGGPRDLPERQRTLRSTIAWSHELLGQDEQVVFRRLSVFSGGCSFDAAEAVCNAESAVDLLETLTSLVDKSLVRQRETATGEPRFSLLETIREYADERLHASEEAHELRRRHTSWCLAYARGTDARLRSGSDPQALEQMEQEHANLRAALAHSETAAPEVFVQLAAHVGYFWWARSHLREGYRWLERALAREAGEPSDRDRLLLSASAIANVLGDAAKARAYGEERLALARAHGDPLAIARSLGMLAQFAAVTGEFERAIELAEESAAIAPRNESEEAAHFHAVAMHTLGFVHLRAGNWPRAKAACRDSLALARACGNQTLAAFCLVHLASAEIAEEPFEDARPLIDEGLRLASELGFLYMVPVGLQVAALIAASDEQWRRAALLLAAAEHAVEQTGAAEGTPPHLRRLAETTRAALAARLGDDEIEALWTEGCALSLEDAVATALS